jgi:hypothetical protein
MSVRSTHLKLIGATGAAALAAGLLAAPSMAGVSNLTATQVPYSCLNNITKPKVDFAFDLPATTTLVAGQKVPMSGTMHVDLPPGATNLLINTLHWDHFTGVVKAPSPSSTLGINLTVPLTAVGAPDTPTPVDTNVGNAYLDYPTAGTKTIAAGSFTATLTGFSGGNQVGNPVAIPCVLDTGADGTLLDGTAQPVTVTVTKDASKTVAKAKYAAAKHQVTGTATVKGKTYGLVGSGKVTFILKKGTKTIATHTGKLNKKGVATTLFKSVSKKGKWSITAKFPGNGGLKASKARAPFTV